MERSDSLAFRVLAVRSGPSDEVLHFGRFEGGPPQAREASQPLCTPSPNCALPDAWL